MVRIKMMDANEEVRSVLEKFRIIAVVGLSRDPSKDSHKVAKYLKEKGYGIIPINSFADEILGEKCYKSLLDLPKNLQKNVEIVDIFRPTQDVPSIVDQAIQLKEMYGTLAVIWMQLGIMNEQAAKRARNAGLTVIMDKCMVIEHKRLAIEDNDELRRIRLRKMQNLINRIGDPQPEASP